ncbi:histidinol dehydrogenase [Flagellimonas sp. DF-77]|uniref:histidinol dehydrogenase n=1 Tax=Flagellimonas algarum TaxID=3230298 RepID=UPI00339AFDF2
MKKILKPNRTDWPGLLERPTQTFTDIEPVVSTIFNEVALNGDATLKKYTERFDKVALERFEVSDEEVQAAQKQVSQELKEAIALAQANIKKFHAAQRTEAVKVETMPGVQCWQEKRPIQRVGLYIPGGTAPLFSTILMLAVPANLAGCEEIVLCSPPNVNGELDPTILYTAIQCGVTRIFKIGGIQAIAAMTLGTESVPKVDKIFGPGNQYVTVAKQWATRFGVAIDMPAGPSELMVVADRTANPAFVASDLLSQAEHGTDSQVILVTTDVAILDAVTQELAVQIEALPRKEIAKQAIGNSRLIYVETDSEAIAMMNAYGPEHLIVCVENESTYLDGIKHAGSVFVGDYTPESAGDYASGTNHTLPTNGYAKQYSGVNLDSFMKNMTFQKISGEGLKAIGNSVELMAAAEGLQAHKNAVSIRLKQLDEGI